MAKHIAVNLSVMPESEAETVKTMEVLTRAATGLAFEGLSVSISISNFEDEES